LYIKEHFSALLCSDGCYIGYVLYLESEVR
jgi:hypothetical protein